MIKNLTKQFIKEEDGAGLLEYLILAALAAIVAVFLFPSLREAISTWFKNMMSNVNGALSGSSGGGGGNTDTNPPDPSGW